MKVCLFCDAEETATNIGVAKALIETGLAVKDLNEIARYLLIYTESNAKEEKK